MKQRKCEVKIDAQFVMATFHGFFQRARVIEPSPMIGGHPGGTVAYPVALVEFENGQVVGVEAVAIKFVE